MTQCLVQEKHQASDVLIDQSRGFGVGWVCQEGRTKNIFPVWAGNREAFLLIRGDQFADTAKASAAHVLQLYETIGSDFVASLNGWFYGVLVDLQRRTITLFNDRYGLGRIYFHENADGFFFASEAKALLKLFPALRCIDPRGLAEWFTCGCVLQNRSLFSGISLLPPGSAWTFGTEGTEKRSYFKQDAWENQTKLDEDSYYRKLRDTFSRVLPRYLDGGQRVAVSLTGGLDGRIIMAWSRKRPGELPCYTFSGSYRESRDVQVARQVARTCGQPHQTILVNDRFLSEFPALAEKAVYTTDGAMDVSGAAELYVNRKAREVAPVRMTGNYGSEILRGNVAFRPWSLSIKIFDSDLCVQAKDAAALYAEERRGSRLSFIAFKQVPWHHFARFAVEQSQLTVRSPFLDNDLVELAFQAPATMRTGSDLSYRLVADGNAKLGRIPTDRGVAYSSATTLNKFRQAKEEFLTRVEYAYDYGMPQWLARIDWLLSPLRLERLFLGRQKFCHFRVWYRDRLASYVKEVLLDPRSLSRSYLRRREVEQMVTDHLRGTGNFTMEINKLLSVELLQRLLIERR